MDKVNISIKVVDDLTIRQRRGNELLGYCPVCGSDDANFNLDKLVWNCFDESSLVTTDFGIIPIKDVEQGMKVLSGKGKFNTVVRTFKSLHTDNVLYINSKSLTRPVICTENHKIFTYVNGCLEETEAKNLVNGSLVVVPIISDFVDCKCLYSNSIKIDVTNEFLRVAGLFIAEGSTSYNKKGYGRTEFSFNSSELSYIDEVVSYFEKVFSLRPYIRTKNNVTKLVFTKTTVTKMFSELFGRGCENKSIPNDLTRLPKEKAKILLSGILDGDGYTTKTWAGHYANRLRQTSEILSLQVRQIAAYCGFSSSLTKSKDYYNNTRKQTYINWLSETPKKLKVNLYNYGEWFSVIKIDSIKSNHYKGYVYDLAVDTDHMYTVNGILVHNCWHCLQGKGRIIPEEGYEMREVEHKVLDIPKIRELYGKLADTFHSNLSVAADYLKERGFTQETLEKYKIGFCSSEYYEEYDDEIAEDAGILVGDFPMLSNRITIPYIVNGEVVDIRGRQLETKFSYNNKAPKYLSLAGGYESRGANYLFNHDAIKDNDRVIVTEGELKALAAIQYEYPCVATPGIMRWLSSWSDEMKDKDVIVVPDREKVQGRRKPAYIMVKNLMHTMEKLKVVVLPLEKDSDKIDIDTMLLQEGGLKKFDFFVRGAIDSKKYMRLEEKRAYGRRK